MSHETIQDGDDSQTQIKTKSVKKKRTRRRVGPDGLSARERAFVAAFVQTLAETAGKGNASKAAEMIGCPKKSAAQRGCGFMKLDHVKSAIAVHIDQITKCYDITTETILSKLRPMAYTGMSTFVRVADDGGNLYMDFSTATDEELDALTEVTVEEYMEGKGDNARNVKKTRIKMDRRASLELLGKYKKMWTDKMSLENPDGTPLVPPTMIIEFVEAKPKKEE